MHLPTIDFFGHRVSRLICGGNPLSGFSHFSGDMDREMIDHYTMPNIQALLAECWRQGVTTFQSRGDRHQMRAYHEHRLGGGQLHWIAQTASEFSSMRSNIAEIARYGAIAIYNHGTWTDNSWHKGNMDSVLENVKIIKEHGLPAGVGTHIPEVIDHIEGEGWPVDFYMACAYNLARGYKSAPAVDQDAYARDKFMPEDPPRMAEVVRRTPKPCLFFKIMAASRNCTTPEATRAALQFAFDHIKPTDAVVVGMLQKHKNQVAENAGFVREILG
jgi:hypothetical protein